MFAPLRDEKRWFFPRPGAADRAFVSKHCLAKAVGLQMGRILPFWVSRLSRVDDCRDRLHKILSVIELVVNAGEADVGDFIQFCQVLHHDATD